MSIMKRMQATGLREVLQKLSNGGKAAATTAPAVVAKKSTGKKNLYAAPF